MMSNEVILALKQGAKCIYSLRCIFKVARVAKAGFELLPFGRELGFDLGVCGFAVWRK